MSDTRCLISWAFRGDHNLSEILNVSTWSYWRNVRKIKTKIQLVANVGGWSFLFFFCLRDWSYQLFVYQALEGLSRYRENETSPYDQLALPTHKLVRPFYAFSLINRTGLEFDRCLTRTYVSDALIARSRRLPRVLRISIASRGKRLCFIRRHAVYIFGAARSLLGEHP